MKQCNKCRQYKPPEIFGAHKETCKSCRNEYHACRMADKRDQERYQQQVKVNRMINSLPVLR